MAHQLSCNPVQIFGLTTVNELAPALHITYVVILLNTIIVILVLT